MRYFIIGLLVLFCMGCDDGREEARARIGDCLETGNSLCLTEAGLTFLDDVPDGLQLQMKAAFASKLAALGEEGQARAILADLNVSPTQSTKFDSTLIAALITLAERQRRAGFLTEAQEQLSQLASFLIRQESSAERDSALILLSSSAVREKENEIAEASLGALQDSIARREGRAFWEALQVIQLLRQLGKEEAASKLEVSSLAAAMKRDQDEDVIYFFTPIIADEVMAPAPPQQVLQMRVAVRRALSQLKGKPVTDQSTLSLLQMTRLAAKHPHIFSSQKEKGGAIDMHSCFEKPTIICLALTIAEELERQPLTVNGIYVRAQLAILLREVGQAEKASALYKGAYGGLTSTLFDDYYRIDFATNFAKDARKAGFKDWERHSLVRASLYFEAAESLGPMAHASLAVELAKGFNVAGMGERAGQLLGRGWRSPENQHTYELGDWAAAFTLIQGSLEMGFPTAAEGILRQLHSALITLNSQDTYWFWGVLALYGAHTHAPSEAFISQDLHRAGTGDFSWAILPF